MSNVIPVEITNEVKTSFINYAMSVIVDRALPDVRDGLKPVQRRILYAMLKEGLASNKKHVKSAGVVGEVIKKYHPHGDSPIYEAMVRMAQNWNLRYPLVDGQGNFGCFTAETKIKLLDGTEKSFVELAQLPKDEIFYVYSVNKQGKIVVGEGRYSRITKKNAQIIELTFDDGSKVRCTPDHRFMLRDQSWKEAQYLTIDDSLMAGYFDKAQINTKTAEYLRVHQPLSGKYEFVHHLADEYNVQKDLTVPIKAPFVRHHINFNRFDNRPTNIKRMGWSKHLQLHAEHLQNLWQNENFRVAQANGVRAYYSAHPEIREIRRQRMIAQNKNEEFRLTNGPRISRILRKRHQNNPNLARQHGNHLRQLWQDPDYRAEMSKALTGIVKKPLSDEQKAVLAQMISIKSKKMWADLVKRSLIIEKIVDALKNPEIRQKLSVNSKNLWENADYRAKFSSDHHKAMAKKLWQDPKTRVLHREKMVSQWEDESFRLAHLHGRQKDMAKRLVEKPDLMLELNEPAVLALRKNWRDQNYQRRVMRSKIAGYVARLMAEFGKDNVNIDLFNRKRASWVPNLNKSLRYFDSFEEIVAVASTHNHRVVDIKWLNERVDVYDITVNEHHNFMLANGCIVHNSIDGDPAAAYRYTEARLTKVAEDLLADIERETIDFRPNFDETTEEPTVLPSAVPNMLINGASGIAVGMATNIPPHNLTEICNGLLALIDKPETDLDELMRIIPGPDFPTGARIGKRGLREAYETGQGVIRVRGKVRIEDKNGRNQIVINEIPYQVNKTNFITTIAAMYKSGKIPDISMIRDESDRQQAVRVVIELKRGALPELVLNQLYKYTQLQSSFNIINLAIVNGEPKVLPIKRAMELFLDHRRVVVTRRTEFELKKARDRAHLVEGLLVALSNIDDIIALIRASQSTNEARDGLMVRFGLSEAQATSILEMRLQRLTALEQDRLQKEYIELQERISDLLNILGDEKRLWNEIKTEIKTVRDRFGDERRTIITDLADDIAKEDLIAVEDMVITVTKNGYIKRTALEAYRSQGRGGRGASGGRLREEDTNTNLLIGSSHEYLLFFTDRGRVYREKIFELPEAGRDAKGAHLKNVLPLQDDEQVKSILAVKNLDQDGYFVFCTRKGIIKKTEIRDYGNITAAGLIAINLIEGDDLIEVACVNSGAQVVLATKDGQAIRFGEDDVRATGRATQGVIGIRLKDGDQVVSMAIVSAEDRGELLAVSENGYGKRTLISEYPVQGRGGQGVITMKVTDKTGHLVSLETVRGDEELMVLSQNGVVIRTKVDEVSTYGRPSQGVKVMKIGENDQVISAFSIKREETL